MTRKTILDILKKQRDFLQSEYGVSQIGLFGFVAQGSAGEDSDIDLVVEFEQPIGFRFFELADYLESQLGKPVDILTRTGIEDIRLPEVIEEIEKTLVYV